MERDTFFDRVRPDRAFYPAGRVATYGQIARLAGAPRGARMVGWVMHSVTSAEDVPWHRVVNASGQSSLREGVDLQHALLADEGVEFELDGRVDLKRFGWDGEIIPSK